MATWYKTVIQEFKEGETEQLEISVYSDGIEFKNHNGDIITISIETFEIIEYLINQTE